MKNYLLKLVLAYLFLYSSSDLKAQTDISRMGESNSFVTLGVVAGVGITPRQSRYNYGLTVELNAQHQFTDELSGALTIGYRRLLTKDTSPMPDLDFIPLMAGVKIFPINHAFVDAMVGVGLPIIKNQDSGFIFGSGLGIEINHYIDLSIRYEGYRIGLYTLANGAYNGQYALRFLYRFKL